jgi:hypothetical protein
MEAASSHFKSFERNPATDSLLFNVSMRANLFVNAAGALGLENEKTRVNENSLRQAESHS